MASLPEAAAGRRVRPDWTLLLAVALCLPAFVPLLVIVQASLTPQAEIWAHLSRYVLPGVALNTLKLVIGVAVVAGALGTALAWLTALCDFPGRRFFDWALLLPLAVPTYVLAFVAVGFLDYTGPLQSALRAWTGSSAWVPPIRSTGGVVAVLSLALYPYVYLLARTAFMTQGRKAMEAASTLGLGRAAATWRVALPMARPWIAAGIALACMETLADFGAVAVFNYDTFTTAIYRAWFGMFSIDAALQLAGVLLILVVAAFVLERMARGASARFSSGRDLTHRAPPIVLGPRLRWVVFVLVALVFAVAFALPVLQLCLWAFKHRGDIDLRYWGYVGRSLLLAGSAALIIVTASVVLAYLARRRPGVIMQSMVRLATIGYAVPGTVLAVGIAVPLVMLNNGMQHVLRSWLGDAAPAVFLQGTLLAALIAYMARFLAVGFHPVDSGLQRIARHVDEAAAGLGVVGAALVRRVHAPLLRTSLATAATLVFVDVMKEMPITLITRPPGWDTLAVRVWEMTSEGEWERAALPAVAIVLAGLVPVAMLMRRGDDVA